MWTTCIFARTKLSYFVTHLSVVRALKVGDCIILYLDHITYLDRLLLTGTALPAVSLKDRIDTYILRYLSAMMFRLTTRVRNWCIMHMHMIWMLRGYAIRSGRRPEGSQRPAGPPRLLTSRGTSDLTVFRKQTTNVICVRLDKPPI